VVRYVHPIPWLADLVRDCGRQQRSSDERAVDKAAGLELPALEVGLDSAHAPVRRATIRKAADLPYYYEGEDARGGGGAGVSEAGLSERLVGAITAHRADAEGDAERPHACSPRCSADVRRHAGDVSWAVRSLGVAWDTHLHNVPLVEVDGQLRWKHECAGDCAVDIAQRFTSRCGEWRDSRLISFEEHLDNLLAELNRHGVRVRRDQLAFACMPALSRAGRARPPEHLLLDAAGGAEHYDALVAVGCTVVEVRGSGWISGRRYLVLLDHAWNRGSDRPVANSWVERRGTMRFLPAWLFEALEHRRLTRHAVHSLGRRCGFRETFDIPSRPGWNVGEAGEQGCPTVAASLG
jgi:hypothetical protein